MDNTVKYKNLTVTYALVQSFMWIAFAAIMGFSSLYLLENGFSNTEIGILIAVAGVISAVLQPAIASYADRPSSLPLKRIVFILCMFQVAAGVLLFLTYRRSAVLTGMFYGSLITVLQLLLPLINSLGMESINQGKALNFGVSRGMGSVAYAIVAYLLGIIAEKSGAVSVPVFILVSFALLACALLVFPFEKKAVPEAAGRKAGQDSPAAFFRRYKRFGIVLIGCVLVYLSHVLLNSFTFQIVESKGGGSPEMGTVMAISAMIELPTMFFFGFMLKKLRCHVWFRMCGIFFMLKALGTLLAPGIGALYGVQVFQMLGWALISVSSVYYVNSVMEDRDAIKGQAYITMTYTLGSVAGALLGGAMIDQLGVNAMLIFATVSALGGMLILLFATEKK